MTPHMTSVNLEQIAVSLQGDFELLITHRDADYALAWVRSEPAAAGGYNLWASADTDDVRYGHDIARELARQICGEDELAAGGFVIQVCDHENALAEIALQVNEVTA
ncbi:hypothetical protein [Actinomadura rudentiformis]|uniref:Uncharacterized protein n=1 Tax=Actinomadura rudentiformis TaxID=359158 RepID=A0A6H9YUH3_9ACTN|nr:hypothetical protein [Actinomadura rudentiformis]KAB2347306.1 hypothetical protein F8566_20045 [Actinomadura rudentiformis]